MLEVVEQEQELPVSDVLPELLARPERLGRRLEHQARLAQRRERHPPDAVLVLGDELRRGLEGEPRLARAADPREREQAHRLAAKQIDDLGDLLRPPEERRRRDGEVRLVQAPERGEVVVPELVDALGSGEVLEPVLAQVAEPVSAHEGRGRGGDHHLAAVGAGGDPGGAVHVCAHVALVRQVRRAGVQAHAHADRPGGERTLPLGRRLERARGGGEDVEEGVPLGVHLHAAVTGEGFAQEPPVLGERLPRTPRHRARAAVSSSPRCR